MVYANTLLIFAHDFPLSKLHTMEILQLVLHPEYKLIFAIIHKVSKSVIDIVTLQILYQNIIFAHLKYRVLKFMTTSLFRYKIAYHHYTTFLVDLSLI